jgi:hypothetical protein
MVLSDEAQVTLNRYAARNDYSQPDIVKALRAVGFTVDIIGWPVDLLLHSPTNKVSLMECKNEDWNGKWSKKQKDQKRYVKEHGVPVVTTPEQALKAVGVL